MTKKSANRILRDQAKSEDKAAKAKEVKEYLNTNTIYDDLKELHDKLVGQIQSFGLVGALSQQPELIAKLDDPAAVSNKIRLLAIDIGEVGKDLNKTYDMHKEFTGGAKDVDEHMNALVIFQNYTQIASVIEGTIMPTVGTVMECFTNAEKKLKAEFEANQTANTNTALDA